MVGEAPARGPPARGTWTQPHQPGLAGSARTWHTGRPGRPHPDPQALPGSPLPPRDPRLPSRRSAAGAQRLPARSPREMIPLFPSS